MNEESNNKNGSGKSKLYSRKCFGYKHSKTGELIIDQEQAEVVRFIYNIYLVDSE